MAGFKSAVIREIDNFIDAHHLVIDKFNRQNRLWQRNYWDRIIRNEEEYERIIQYIKNNPIHWEQDKLYGLTE